MYVLNKEMCMAKLTQASKAADHTDTISQSPCGRVLQWLSSCLPCMQPEAGGTAFDYQKLQESESLAQLKRNHENKNSSNHVML
jgi:hypothetical protein